MFFPHVFPFFSFFSFFHFFHFFIFFIFFKFSYFFSFLLVEPVYCCCTVVTSQADAVDMTVTYFSAHRRLGPKSDRTENNSHPCAQRTLHPFCVVFHACMVAEPVFLELGY